MRNRQKKLVRYMSDKLIRRAFSESSLHRFFRSGNYESDVIATFDLVDVSKQREVDLALNIGRIGIVIQGPVVENTTLNFCAFIRSTYPDISVVLSTWEDEDVSKFKALQDEYFQIVQSKRPAFHGPSNINLQIVSSRAGIELLEKLGCSHILKTRTDIFLTNPQFINYLIWACSKGMPNAIVFSSFNSFLFRLFSVSDQVMFGKTADIAKFWHLNLVPENSSVTIPEIHLFYEYIKSFGFQPEETLESYLSALAEYSVIADHEQLGQTWNKGAFTALNYRWRGKNFPHIMSPLSYWMWDLIGKDNFYFQDLYKRIT